MQVIGIGTGGSQIATELAQHEAYDVMVIDTSFKEELNNVEQILIDSQETIKEYEEKTSLDISKKVGHNNVHVFLFGGGKTTGATLRILQRIKDKKITVHYVRPEKNFLSNKQKLRELKTVKIVENTDITRKEELKEKQKLLKKEKH